MTFSEALATQPDWVRLWVLWLNVVTFATFAALLFSRAGWRAAAAIFGANLLMVPVMLWLYQSVGYVRLLGLPHLIFWTPLAIWLIGRQRRPPRLPGMLRWLLWVYIASISVSLGFDAADVARYLLGERGSMIPPGAGPG